MELKKWAILGLVILGCLILGLQFFISRSERNNAARLQPVQEQPMGAAAPAPVQPTSSVPTEANLPPVISKPAANVSYGPISLPNPPAYKGECPEGSPSEIAASHGRAWGYFAKGTTFSNAETEKMYGYMTDYIGCVSVARGSADLCSSLPAAAEQGEIKVPLEMSPYYKCLGKSLSTLFYAYMAGKITNPASCQAALSGLPAQYRGRITGEAFCAEAAKGMENLSAFLLKYIPDQKAAISRFLPSSEADCGGEAGCVRRYREYKAVKTGSAAGCPKTDPYCEAFVTRSEQVCDKSLIDMSTAYCAYSARVKKQTGGYLGMTPEEVKADLERKKAQQAVNSQLPQPPAPAKPAKKTRKARAQ